jgi:[protein-PII] uridylyltransferase
VKSNPAEKPAGQEWLQRIKDEYAEGSLVIKEMHFSGAGGMEVVKAVTAHTDSFIRAAFEKVCADLGATPKKAGWALAAIGGYGRGELNPYSDIDIMFIGRDGSLEKENVLPTKALHLLWDMGFNIGYSVRTPADCCSLAKTDFTIMTSLLESRLICGEKEVFSAFLEKMKGVNNPKAVEEFIREKLLERTKRHKKYGDSVYLREPNIKEGAGGLRDIHAAMWIARIKYGIDSLAGLKEHGVKENEIRRLRSSRDYLLRLRNELHYLSGHRQDVLTFELQEIAAKDFGYTPRPNRLAVENFMRAYFLRARSVRDITQAVIEKALDKRQGRKWFFLPEGKKKINDRFYSMGRMLCLSGNADEVFRERPETMLEAFLLSRSGGISMSDNLREAIKENIAAVNRKTGLSKDAARIFLDIIGKLDGLYETLDGMHKMRVLGKYLPEFGATTAMVQHDMYHKYTVDEHALLAVKKVQELFDAGGMAHPEFADALMRVRDRDRQSLVLAVLLHDTGKALGKGHSERGARIAVKVCQRLGMDDDDAGKVEFLIRNHLLMAHIAQRRELSDPRVLEKFCRIVDSPELLDMLYILTYADMSAVGPDLFNDWKRMLLKELHGRALAFLKDEVSAIAGEKERIAGIKKDIIAKAKSEKVGDAAEVRKFIENLPPNYVLSVPPETVLRHFKLSRGLNASEIIVDHENAPRGYTNLTIILHELSGVLHIAAGALAVKNMNILSAQIFTGKDGIIVDTLQVTDYNKKPLFDDEIWEDIKGFMKKLLSGQLCLDRAFPSMPAYPRKTSLKDVPAKVLVDNEASDRYTVLEVYAKDRVGLLHDITRELFRMGCYISSAKVDTDVDQVVDVFYVTDIFRQKVEDKERIEAIKVAILAAVTGGK